MSINEIIRRASENDPKALHELGLAYLKGNPMRKNTEEARKFLIFASQLGCVDAYYDLGMLYLDANDTVRALDTFKNGYRTGCYKCGAEYGKLLLAVDENKALDVLTDSAANGDDEARRALYDYFNSIGEPESAEEWLEENKTINITFKTEGKF